MNVTLSVTAESKSDLDILNQILDLLSVDPGVRFEHSVKSAPEEYRPTIPAPTANPANDNAKEPPSKKRKPGRPRKSEAEKAATRKAAAERRRKKQDDPNDMLGPEEGGDDGGENGGWEEVAEAPPKKGRKSKPKPVKLAEDPTRKQVFAFARAYIHAKDPDALQAVCKAMDLGQLADIEQKDHAEFIARMCETLDTQDEVDGFLLSAGIEV